jgi:hypothetical protein
MISMPQGRRLLLGALLAAYAVLGACVSAPPVQEMSDARQAIAAAEQANAARLAPIPLSDARRFIAEAETQLLSESYGQARANALRAKNRAAQALQLSEAAAREGE